MVDLIVKAGPAYEIGKPFSAIFNNFVMEDNAQITCKASVVIQAINATFGNNCKIICSGESGTNAANQNYVPPGADYCNSGAEGRVGNPGVHGTNGYDFTLQIGLQSIGSLSIQSNGGHGGNGGKGGDGAKGGQAKCLACRGGGGGRGGMGGNGGNGGDSGQITLIWAPLPSYKAAVERRSGGREKFDNLIHQAMMVHGGLSIPSTNTQLSPLLPSNLELQYSGGMPGASGHGGPGGHGGDGVSCLFNAYGMNGGDPGGVGLQGSVGAPGRSKIPVVHIAS
jgi:hypothetical protein